ncbi:hypothetical protein JW865_04665 [Candidatus Bathyarchaeota archaeon]|nr:hypothetical protein [Candidatus Bathyarchaeota archaeon]
MVNKMGKQKSINTEEWVDKYQDEFISKNLDEETNLDLFQFTLDKINIFRIRILLKSGLSNFNKSHQKIIKKINQEFEDYINVRLQNILHIKKSKGDIE